MLMVPLFLSDVKKVIFSLYIYRAVSPSAREKRCGLSAQYKKLLRSKVCSGDATILKLAGKLRKDLQRENFAKPIQAMHLKKYLAIARALTPVKSLHQIYFSMTIVVETSINILSYASIVLRYD